MKTIDRVSDGHRVFGSSVLKYLVFKKVSCSPSCRAIGRGS